MMAAQNGHGTLGFNSYQDGTTSREFLLSILNEKVPILNVLPPSIPIKQVPGSPTSDFDQLGPNGHGSPALNSDQAAHSH